MMNGGGVGSGGGRSHGWGEVVAYGCAPIDLPEPIPFGPPGSPFVPPPTLYPNTAWLEAQMAELQKQLVAVQRENERLRAELARRPVRRGRRRGNVP